jgi:hypothetical protein
LGGGFLGAEELKRHPYFDRVEWNAFLNKTVMPPFRPKTTSPADVSNFNAEYTSEPVALTPVDHFLGPKDQAEFNDFDYTADWVWSNREKAISY